MREDAEVCNASVPTTVLQGPPSPVVNGVCVPQYQPGPQLLDTASRALAAAGLWHMPWHKPPGASLSTPLPCDRSTWSTVWLGQEKVTQCKWPVHPLDAGLIKRFVDSPLGWGKEYFGNNSEKGEGWKWFTKGCFSLDYNSKAEYTHTFTSRLFFISLISILSCVSEIKHEIVPAHLHNFIFSSLSRIFPACLSLLQQPALERIGVQLCCGKRFEAFVTLA